MQIELERLLKDGESLPDDPLLQKAWSSQVRHLLDRFLGPGPHNIHSEAFYEFDFAQTHEEKMAVLRAVLLTSGAKTAGAVAKYLRTLADRGAKIAGDKTAEQAWACETKRCIDVFLGPGPHNIHSEAFYEFDFAESHTEKMAILHAILLAGSGVREESKKEPVLESAAPPSESIPDLFLSHVEEDQECALKIADALESAGYSVWSTSVTAFQASHIFFRLGMPLHRVEHSSF